MIVLSVFGVLVFGGCIHGCIIVNRWEQGLDQLRNRLG